MLQLLYLKQSVLCFRFYYFYNFLFVSSVYNLPITLSIERLIIMNDDREKKNQRIKLAKKIGLIVAGLFFLYLILGFWVVAPLLKPKLEDQLSSLIGRKVTIDEIKFNPLVLSTTISKLTVYEIDGQPFTGFETLYANAQMSSVFRWALTVKEIRVQGPFGMLKLLPGNKLNIDDILAKLSAPKKEPEEKAEVGLPRAIIESFKSSMVKQSSKICREMNRLERNWPPFLSP
jgi:hypothetical protein